MNMRNYDWISKLVRAPADAPAGADPKPSADVAASADTTAPAETASPALVPQAPDHSWVPEKFVKDGTPDFAALRAEYDELAARMTAAPESADGYDLTIPADLDYGDLKLPEGFGFELSQDEAVKPLLDDMRGLLHKHHLPKEAAGEFLGLMARYKAFEVAEGMKTMEAEMSALGANGATRIADITRSLEAKLPKELADAVKAAVTSANGVRALEKLLTPSTISTGPASPATPDTAGMTPRQKIDHANMQAMQKRA